MHFFLLSLHLICAVCFVGYVFFDACIYAIAYKKMDKALCDSLKHCYTKNGGGIIVGLLFFALVFSGVALLSFYSINSLFSYFGIFQVLLVIKISLVFLILSLAIFAIIFTRILHRNDPFRGKSHLIAWILSLCVIVLAKAMQYFS